jgi:methionyl-tRNA formyltransferase
MNKRRLRIVALLARKPGLLVLRDALLGNCDLDLAAVFTHGRLPKSEGGASRKDIECFRILCEPARVPLIIIDYPQAGDISALLPQGPLDLMVSLSWRCQVPQHVLKRFRLGCVNIHRGELPDYAGALPVQRAIEAGAVTVAITVHEMVPEIDAGREIARVWLPIAPLPPNWRAADYAEVVKAELGPLYAPLCRLALRAKMAEDRT